MVMAEAERQMRPRLTMTPASAATPLWVSPLLRAYPPPSLSASCHAVAVRP